MAFEDYGTPKPSKYVTVGGFTKTGEKNPDSFEGFYLSTTTRPSNFDPGKTETNFLFQTVEGLVSVKGNANLIRVLSDAQKNFTAKTNEQPEGYLTLITFDGMEKRPQGRTLKLFRVQIDKDQKVNASDVLSTFSAPEVEEDEIDEVQAANLAAAERRAKLNAALAKGKSAK